jgi:Arabinose-binding domain of AraC transcription regulator, N-term
VSQIALLDEAAIALKDDCIGFTLARDFDLREIGLLYYVMASSQTLGDALKRIARYSKITNEALVFGYREGNRLIISLSYSGVPRHSDRHQIEFCMFAAIRICRVLTGQNLVPQHFSFSHYRSKGTSEMARFIGTKGEFGADTDEFALNIDARALPVIHSDPYLNDLLMKYCEAALAARRGDMSQFRTRVENAISSLLPHGRVLVEDVARSRRGERISAPAASWCDPAGESPAQVRSSVRLVASVARPLATVGAKRTQRLRGVWD